MGEPGITAVHLLIQEGWKRSNELHRFIVDNPVNPMATWPNKVMFLALLCYATSLAKFTSMDRDDFLTLAAAFYDNVQTTQAPAEDGTDTQG